MPTPAATRCSPRKLAARGMTGPSPIFEGRGGYFTAVSRQPFELAPFGGEGQPFTIMDCLIKRFPLGQYSQSVVQAALEARARVADVATSRRCMCARCTPRST